MEDVAVADAAASYVNTGPNMAAAAVAELLPTVFSGTCTKECNETRWEEEEERWKNFSIHLIMVMKIEYTRVCASTIIY